MTFDRRLLKLIGSAKFYFVLTVLLSIVSGVLVIFWAYTLSKIVALVFLEGQQLEQVLPLIGILLGISLVRAVLVWGGEVCAALVSTRVKIHLRTMLVGHIQKLGPSFIKNESTGALATSALQGVELLDAFYSQYLPQLIIATCLPLLILVIIFPIDWLSAAVFLVTAPLIPVFMILIGKTSELLTRKQFDSLKKMSAYFLDTLQGLTTLKLLNRGQTEIKKIADVSEAYRQQTMSVLRLTFLSALVLEWLSTLSVAVVAVEIGVRLLYARMGFEQAFFILVIAPEFYLPLRTLGLRFHASASGVAAARKIFDVLSLPVNLPQKNELSSGRNKNEVNPPYTITFKNVSYLYAQRDTSALEKINFELRAGQHVALVGASGSGKSTIINLLLGFLYPTDGKIMINGVNLDDLSIAWWRSQVAWVPQRPTLFNTSIGENIKLGNSTASPDDIWQAAAQANLDGFIRSLPQGIHTPVGEKGAAISGGQAQRIALARAFLRDAPLVLLDEPTSHIDPEMEILLTEATQRLCRERTVLTIAHRLSTVIQNDQVIVLDHGRIIEAGAPAQLAVNNEAYQALLAAYRGGTL